MDLKQGNGGADNAPHRPDPPVSGPCEIGSVVAGRYRVLRLLGKGAMGAVYVAEHMKIGRKDAIKVLQEAVARDPETVARFTRGARNASAIRHPNVCTVYDFGETEDGLAFLAMEYVDGESLSDLLNREGALDLEPACDILCQVADALAAAHAAGIVHRDLKPANVMLAQSKDGSPRAKVVDFDIAKGGVEGEGTEVTRMGFVVGTPEFMSPEQLTGDPLDGRCDVYSLGVLLFRTLTGSLPHLADSTQELMVKRLTESPMRLDEAAPRRVFPRSLQSLLDRALQRRPADRLESATEFSRALREVQEEASAGAALDGGGTAGGTVPPTRVARPERTESARLRGRRWLMGAGTALLAIAVVTVGSLVLLGGGRTLVIEPSRVVLMVAGTVTLVAAVLDEDESLADGSVGWSSDAPEVARVDGAGLVTAGAVGTARITARDDQGEGSATVTVIPATRIDLDPTRLEFRVRQGAAPPEPLVARIWADGPVRDGRVEARDPSGLAAPWVQSQWVESGETLAVAVAPDPSGMTIGPHEAIVTVTARPEGQDLLVGADLAVSLVVEGGSDPAPPQEDSFITSPDQIEPLLTRQEQALNGIILGDRPRDDARAVEDTARAVLAVGWLSQEQRAEAAFVLAGALLELRSCENASRWAREAVRLAPDERGYRTFLDQAERCGS